LLFKKAGVTNDYFIRVPRQLLFARGREKNLKSLFYRTMLSEKQTFLRGDQNKR
jgi:hypothetical protein